MLYLESKTSPALFLLFYKPVFFSFNKRSQKFLNLWYLIIFDTLWYGHVSVGTRNIYPYSVLNSTVSSKLRFCALCIKANIFIFK